jgi:membrane fusion protein, multidrug efflux system
MGRTIRLVLSGALVLLAGCASESKERQRPPPLVRAAPVVQHLFVDTIQSEGTLRANEQVTIASAVTERVERVLFDDTMPVRRGQLLAVLSQGQEVASLRGANAAEAQARAQYERIKALFDRGFATRAQLDLQQAAAERARADAAEAQAAIADRMIRAPFAGYTGLRNISAGAVVAAGTPLVTVSDLSRVKLDFTVPETQLTGISVGRPIEARAAAFPGEIFGGRIASIDPVIDPNSRAVMVRAIMPNPGARLKPGMLLSVRIQREARMAMAVPELAVVGSGDERAVFVIGPESKAKRIVVQTGLRDKGLIEVSGVPAGARVISEGVQKVTDGMRVRLPGAGGPAGMCGPAGKGAG